MITGKIESYEINCHYLIPYLNLLSIIGSVELINQHGGEV